jgi:transposase
MAGIDPAVRQSGKYEGSSKITKRGNRHLRRIIWLMTTQVIHYGDVFRVYYRKRRKDGLPYKKAVLATAHKLDSGYLYHADTTNSIQSGSELMIVD